MNYLYCDERGQRISGAVCEHNFKTGKCSKDLFKCQRAREAAKVKGDSAPEIVKVETKPVKEIRPTLQHDGQLSLF